MVKDNPALDRFELAAEDDMAVAAYRREPGVITFTHTVVPETMRGKGIGSALAQGALELVRERGEQVVPRCPFIAAYVQKHPEFAALIRR